MTGRSVVSLFACSAALTWSAAAVAHVRLLSPQPRHPTPANAASGDMIKSSPCGCSQQECPNGDVRDPARVTVFEPGETITLEFDETIPHAGFFRVSFDNVGQDAFEPPPLARGDVQMGTPTLPVLKDNVASTGGGDYSVEITLPNTPCENCTLQLIQVMSTAMSWQEDDVYYTCADIALRGGGGAGGMGSGGMSAGGMAGGGMSAGGMAGGTSAGGMAGAGGVAAGGAATGGAGASGMSAMGGAGMASAGMPGTGGAPTAGSPATGGMPPATGGTGATGGTAPAVTPEEEAGCGCRVTPHGSGPGWLVLAAGAVAAAWSRRRRRAA
jgi:MYXO-CTERM domain-containing protein